MLQQNRRAKFATLWTALIEIASIIFLFYANLLMGEFSRTNEHGKTLSGALKDIFTFKSMVIGVLAASLGFVLFAYLRRRFAGHRNQKLIP